MSRAVARVAEEATLIGLAWALHSCGSESVDCVDAIGRGSSAPAHGRLRWRGSVTGRRRDEACRTASVHEGSDGAGGARMAWARARVSMMIIGAPQWRHTKVGLAAGVGIGQLGMLAEEVQLFGTMSVVQLFEEAPPEQTREHANREEEASFAAYPAIGIERQAAARHDTVPVRMMGEGGSPGVQNECEADACAEVLGVGGDRAQCLGGDVEQQAIDELLVGVGDGADRRGQGEDHVVVIDGQQIRLSRLEPAARGTSLALRAVSVAAGVVGDLGLFAGRAAQHVPAEAGSATALNGGHDLQLPQAQVSSLSVAPCRPVVAEDLRNLRGGTLHGSAL